MGMNGNRAFAFLLIGLGALILLSKAGFVFGHIFGALMGYLFPVAMIFLGYLGIKNGNRWIGWTIAIIGLVILLGKLSWLIGFVIAVGFIVYGVSLLRKRTI